MTILRSMLLLLTVVSTAASASAYRVHIIDPLPENNFAEAFSINNSGTVLVSSSSAAYDTRGAFTWNVENGIETVFSLGTVDFPQRINNNGQVVGVSDDGHTRNAIIFNTNGTFTNLSSLPSETGCWATSINDKGQVVGYSGDAEHAVIWDSSGTPSVIGGDSGRFSSASDINYLGEVVWSSREYLATGLVSSAYRWTSTSSSVLLNPLSANDYTVANAINNDGLVAGQSGNSAALWGTDNVAVELGAFGFANDINASGQIAGALGDNAVLWQSDLTIVDLGALVNSDYSRALGINDSGWVVGYASISGMTRAVRWQPVPEPSTLLAVFCSVGGLAGYGYRKRK